jgi:glycosyltransferase involved in cell wall biosynthesis
MLPLAPTYYRLSASGALIDAITWAKPIISSDIPICADAFRAGGDIGFLCKDAGEMRTVIDRIVQSPDPERYGRQVQALARLRDQRMPAALAETYASILRTRFPAMIGGRGP